MIRKNDSHFTDFISYSLDKDIKIINKMSMWNTDLGIFLRFLLKFCVCHYFSCIAALYGWDFWGMHFPWTLMGMGSSKSTRWLWKFLIYFQCTVKILLNLSLHHPSETGKYPLNIFFWSWTLQKRDVRNIMGLILLTSSGFGGIIMSQTH